MAKDFVPSTLYSCGHYLCKSDFFEWTNAPCKECAAKGMESVTTQTCGGIVRLHPSEGTWERIKV